MITFLQFKRDYENGLIRSHKGIYIYKGFKFKPSLPAKHTLGVLYASYIHDWDYVEYNDRKEADFRLWLNLRIHTDLHPIKCLLAYKLVRWFGWIYYYDLI